MAWVGGHDIWQMVSEEATSEPSCLLASDGCPEQKPLYICDAGACIDVAEVISLLLF